MAGYLQGLLLNGGLFTGFHSMRGYLQGLLLKEGLFYRACF